MFPLLNYGILIPYGDHFQQRLLQPLHEEELTADGRKFINLALESQLESSKEYKSVSDMIKGYKMKIISLYKKLKTFSKYSRDTINITPNSFGDMLYWISLYKMLKSGKSDTFIELDMVNSGFIHLANQIRDEKSLTIANLLKTDKQYDTHSIVQKVFGLETRNHAKEINTPLLHGSSLKTISKRLDIDEESLSQKLHEVYGDSFRVPYLIASWGYELFMKFKVLKWSLPDEFIAFSVSYNTKSEIKIGNINYVGDLLTRQNSNMFIKSEDSTQKGLGLYALMIHSYDAFLMRFVYKRFKERGYELGDVIDKFRISPNNVEFLYSTIIEGLNTLNGQLLTNIKEIETQYGVKAPEELKAILSKQKLEIVNTRKFLSFT